MVQSHLVKLLVTAKVFTTLMSCNIFTQIEHKDNDVFSN